MTRDSEEALLQRALLGPRPRHIGIIMDGNGRWAKARGLGRNEGHRRGVHAIDRCLPALLQLGIPQATFYVFSSENWRRPASEVQFLMGLVLEYAKEDRASLVERGIKVVPIGRWRELPSAVVAALGRLAEDTAGGTAMTAYFAVNYGGRQEIVDAARRVASSYRYKAEELLALDDQAFARLLYAPEASDVDLVVRTSGEMRLSNFLTWQCAYAEMVFTDVLWPDFGPIDLYKAVIRYGERERRFGGPPKG